MKNCTVFCVTFLIIFGFLSAVDIASADSITYDAGTNIITVIGYTEAVPCTFCDIYNCDVAGGWGVVSRQGTDQYAFDAAITVGDGTNDSYLADVNKEIVNTVLVDGNFIKIQTNGYFRSGELVDAALHTTRNGCAFRSLPTATTHFINSVEPVYLYSTYFSINAVYAELICTNGSRMWNCVVAKNLYPKGAEIDIYNVMSSGVIGAWAKVEADNWIILNPTYAVLAFSDDFFKITHTKIIGATYDFYMSTPNKDSFAINVESGWKFYWISGGTAGVVYRQYEFDLNIVDRNGIAIDNTTVRIYDNNSNLVFDGQTCGNGSIATQILNYGTYSQSGGNVASMETPHYIEVSKNGYESESLYVAMDEPRDLIIKLDETETVGSNVEQSAASDLGDDFVQVFVLILTYGAALYVSFGKGKGTAAMGMMLLVLSFFVLLHQMIGLSYNYVYLVSFLTFFLIAVISMTQFKEA